MKKGFTLIEMSIVLVIIALIIAGVLAGDDILENSKRLSVISELQKHKAAYDSFKEKYYAPPGDISDAESVWGTTKTNNGDGDTIIERTGDEDYLAWQHLGLAGFINGYYSGALVAITNVNIGVDIPEGPYGKTGYRFVGASDSILTTTNALLYGRYRSGHLLDSGILMPKQAMAIDQKMDDKNPSEGQLITIAGNGVTSTNCVTVNGAGDEDNTYTIATKTKDCILVYYVDATQQ